MSTANMYEVIRAPRVSEKTARLQEVSNQYVFEVAKTATKADIKVAVEKIFDQRREEPQVIQAVARRTGCAAAPQRSDRPWATGLKTRRAQHRWWRRSRRRRARWT